MHTRVCLPITAWFALLGVLVAGTWLTGCSGSATVVPAGAALGSPRALHYTLRLILGPTINGYSSTITAINDAGDAVGVELWGHRQETSFVVHRDGSYTVVPEQPHNGVLTPVALSGINADGTVVGETENNGAAFTFTSGSGTILSDNSADALSINAHGQVVGHVAGVPVLFDGGLIQPLPLPPLGNPLALGINDRGVIVGTEGGESAGTRSSQPGPGLRTRAVAWVMGTGGLQMHELAVPIAGGDSGAGAVNNLPDPTIAGWDGEVTPAYLTVGHVVLFKLDGTAKDIGGLTAGVSTANAINNADEVVGDVYHFGVGGFLYRPGYGMIDLNTLLPAGSPYRIGHASGINNAHEICGELFPVSGGAPLGFVLSPE